MQRKFACELQRARACIFFREYAKEKTISHYAFYLIIQMA